MPISAQFRRSGQRDDRRRRMLAEESCALSGVAALAEGLRLGDCPGPRKSEHYGDAAFMDDSLRLVDLVPRRLITFGLLMVGGLAMVAGLEALYAWMPTLTSMTTDGRVAALDLDSEGSLGAWFSSLTLVAASLMSLIVYTIRRYKTDDYQGHYRIWLWAAMCWFLMATDESSSLHEGFKEMMVLLTGTRIVGDGSLWWAIPYFFLLGAVGSRLLVDMRQCRLSSAAMVMMAICYAVAAAAQMDLILAGRGAQEVMFEEGAEMVGNLLLLLAMGLHARYVILDAQGLLPRREPRRHAPVIDPEDEEDDAELAPPHRPIPTRSPALSAPHWIDVKPPASSPVLPAEPSPTMAATASAAESQVGRKLTKQEKKALRMRLAQERMKREQQQQGKWK